MARTRTTRAGIQAISISCALLGSKGGGMNACMLMCRREGLLHSSKLYSSTTSSSYFLTSSRRTNGLRTANPNKSSVTSLFITEEAM